MSDSAEQMLNELAQQVVLLNIQDWQSLFTLQELCGNLADSLAQQGQRAQQDIVLKIHSIADDFIQDKVSDTDSQLALLNDLVAQLQGTGSGNDAGEYSSSSGLETGDDSILADFISRALTTLDVLEEQTRNLETGQQIQEALSIWRREIHTIKGESGMLSLGDVGEMCNAIEEALERKLQASVLAGLYHSLDWLREYFGAKDLDHSVRSTAKIFAELAGENTEEESVPSTEDETFCLNTEATLLAEFTGEANEHLENAEVQLLELDADPANQEAINALFRSFHTIKGLAGFMDLDPIQRLAHQTETFLDLCRSRNMSSDAIDLVFTAVDGMKSLADNLRSAIEKGETSLAIDFPLSALLFRIQQAVTNEAMLVDGVSVTNKEESAPQNPPPKLGEILIEEGVVDAETIDDALAQQKDKPVEGRAKLGEVLVREHDLPAKEVSNALRKQRRASQPSVLVRETVKVDALRLDRLVDAIGELVIVESMVSEDKDVVQVAVTGSDLHKRINLLRKITRELQEIATSLRMMPIKGTFQRMARLVRDAASRTGKNVEYITKGEDTELDKNVVDRIGDPLVHMVRNAIDHGLEASPEDRVAVGKPAVGHVELKAYHQGGNICIQISDDGRGMDRERLAAKAVDKGLVSAVQVAQWSDGDVYKLIFHPGFSTADKVSDLSGRGVGMDVVKKEISELRGNVEIDSVLGKGTTFTIRLPLTLAIIDGMACRIGEERYIIPTLTIIRTLRPKAEQIATAMGKGEMLSLQGEVIPLFRIYRLMDIPGAVKDPTEALLVIIDNEGRKVALMVDELLGKQQTVIKNLGKTLQNIPGIAGGAIMSDGSVGLIADPQALIALAHSI